MLVSRGKLCPKCTGAWRVEDAAWISRCESVSEIVCHLIERNCRAHGKPHVSGRLAPFLNSGSNMSLKKLVRPVSGSSHAPMPSNAGGQRPEGEQREPPVG